MLPGAGDLWSTIDDLARFAAALDAGELLGDDSRQLATTVHSPLSTEVATSNDDVLTGEGYGYGYVIGSLFGHRVRYHTGDNPGFRTFQLRCPDLDLSVVILSNQEETEIEQVGLRILTHLGDALGWVARNQAPAPSGSAPGRTDSPAP
jgi:CubicO group peptidase (beta-lactamase class C family)